MSPFLDQRHFKNLHMCSMRLVQKIKEFSYSHYNYGAVLKDTENMFIILSNENVVTMNSHFIRKMCVNI